MNPGEITLLLQRTDAGDKSAAEQGKSMPAHRANRSYRLTSPGLRITKSGAIRAACLVPNRPPAAGPISWEAGRKAEKTPLPFL